MRSNGKAIRDFIYIEDIVELYKILAKNLFTNPKKFSGQVFNAGTNIKHKTEDIIKKIFLYKKKKKSLEVIFKGMSKNKTRGEISYQYMNYKKLKLYLGWKPKYKFKQTLPSLFKWYGLYFKKKNNDDCNRYDRYNTWEWDKNL